MSRPTVLLSAGKVEAPDVHLENRPTRSLRAMTTRATHAETPPATALGTAPWPPFPVFTMSNGWHAQQVVLFVVGFVLLLPTYGMSVVLIMLAFHQANGSAGPHAEGFASPLVAMPMHTSGVQPTLSSAPLLLGQVSPSRERGYDRLLGIFAAHQVVGMPPEQAAPQLAAFFRPMPVGQIESMLRHPQVTALLQPARSDSVHAPPSSESSSEEWWKKAETSEAPAPQPTAPVPGSVGASTGAFWSSEASMPTDTEPVAAPDAFMIGASGGATCGAAGCDRAVTDFDYRCFTCRQRFCMTHRGAGVDCPACAST